MTALITREQFTASLEALVAEKGEDFRYKPKAGAACVYAETPDTPSCGVGYVVHALTPQYLPILYAMEREEPLDEFEGTDWSYDIPGGGVNAKALLIQGVNPVIRYNDGALDFEGESLIPPLNDADKGLAGAAEVFQELQDRGVRYGLCLEAYHVALSRDASGFDNGLLISEFSGRDEGLARA